MGREWLQTDFYPKAFQYKQSSELDLLHTFCVHIGQQIGYCIENAGLKTVFVTGGGAFNLFLLNQIQRNTQAKLFIPSTELVQFKEALIFAFLGVLRIRNEVNVLCSVTGSKRDHVGGALFGNFSAII